MPLVRHPAHHLAPEAVVIDILYTATPAPGAIGTHEEHLSIATIGGNKKRETPVLIPGRRMHRQHL